MFKQSSSRNQKSKGVKVKVKHVLQICLLVSLCFWLIYQVKHSHDKRKEFDAKENGEKVLEKPNEDPLKLGRKDLLPLEEEEDERVVDGEKHFEEEIEDEEEEKKPQIEEEQEQEREIKVDEKEDDERGNGDDELDEEKLEGEIDREEDIIGEEREREEEDMEMKDRQSENESLLEDQEEREDGNDKNTHEAREEHYIADDASSEVTHDGNSLIDYPDTVTKSNNTPEINDRNNSDPLLENDQKPENITSLNVTAGEEKLNETILLQSNDLSSNSTEMVTKMTSNKIFEANESSGNSGIVQNENSGSSEEKRTDEEENNSDSSTVNETVDDSVQHDPIDSSDSVLQEERANRVDLDTLPDIQTEGIDNEDAAAE